MERCSEYIGGSLSLGIARWKSVKGGTYKDGKPITKPVELEAAEIVDGICQRYSCLPSQVMADEVGILRILNIVGQNSEEEKPSG